MFKFNFKDDIHPFIPLNHFCFMAEGDEGGGGSGGDDDGGDQGDDDAGKGKGDEGGEGGEDEAAKAEAGLMADAKEGDAEGEKDSGKTIEFKGDKDTETLNVPEKFWDKEGDKLNEGAVLKSALEAGKEVRKLQNELTEAKKGVPSGVDKEVPEDADGYLGDGKGDDAFIKDGHLQLGEDAKNLQPIPIDDPVVKLFAEVAKEEGFSKDRFERIVSKVLVGVDDAVPVLDLEAEGEKFGPNAKAVAGANKTWADNQLESGALSQAEHVHLLNMGQTAVGLSVVNKLRIASGGKSIPVSASGVTGELPSKEEWYKSKPDHNNEPDAFAKWQEQGKAIFGEGHGGSSESGLGRPADQGGHRGAYEGGEGRSRTRGHAKK